MLLLKDASSERQYIMYEALRKGATVQELHQKTYIKAWFIEQMKELVELEEKILSFKKTKLPDEVFIQAKKDGFADKYLAKLLDIPEKEIRERRLALGLEEAWDSVPVSGADASYYYSTYNARIRLRQTTAGRSWYLAEGPTASARALNLTIAACMPLLPSGMPVMNPSW
jgi:carbamoyl-phosphate synthase large subunit